MRRNGIKGVFGLGAALAAAVAVAGESVLSNAELNRTSGNVIGDGYGTGHASFMLDGGNVGVLDWRSFNIGSAESLTFGRGTWYNAVSGDTPSEIYGQLLGSSADVYLFNPNGVIFGSGSTIDVGNFTAASLSMGNLDTLISDPLGTPTFGLPASDITVRGGAFKSDSLTLLGKNVRMTGSGTYAGDVTVAAGDKIEIDSVGGGTVSFRMNGSTAGSVRLMGEFERTLYAEAAGDVDLGALTVHGEDVEFGEAALAVKAGANLNLAGDVALTAPVRQTETSGEAGAATQVPAQVDAKSRTASLEAAMDVVFFDASTLKSRDVLVKAGQDVRMAETQVAADGNVRLSAQRYVTVGDGTAMPAVSAGKNLTVAADAGVQLDSGMLKARNHIDVESSKGTVEMSSGMTLAAGEGQQVGAVRLAAKNNVMLNGGQIAAARTTVVAEEGRVDVSDLVSEYFADSAFWGQGAGGMLTIRSNGDITVDTSAASVAAQSENGSVAITAAGTLSVVASGASATTYVAADGTERQHADAALAGVTAGGEEGTVALESALGTVNVAAPVMAEGAVSVSAADNVALMQQGGLQSDEKVTVIAEGGDICSAGRGATLVAPTVVASAGRNITGRLWADAKNVTFSAPEGSAAFGIAAGKNNKTGDYNYVDEDPDMARRGDTVVNLDIGGDIDMAVDGRFSTYGENVFKANGNLAITAGSVSRPVNVSMGGNRFYGSANGPMVVEFKDGNKHPIVSAHDETVVFVRGTPVAGGGMWTETLNLEAATGEGLGETASRERESAVRPGFARPVAMVTDLLPVEPGSEGKLDDEAVLEVARKDRLGL